MFHSLKTLFSTSPNVELTDRVVDEWLALFESCEIEHFEQAFRAAKYTSGDFLPSPGAVTKELKELGGDKKSKQTKEWIDYPNGSVVLKITTEGNDEKGKPTTHTRQYVDNSSADKWKYRKRMFDAGLWLTIELMGEKQIIYSYQKWPHTLPSTQFKEGGYHEREGESLPFLVRQ